MIAEDLLFIDIETVSEHPSFDHLPETWKSLWQEKVLRQVPEGLTAADFYPMRAGVMAEFSKVICISIGKIVNGQFRMKSFFDENERNILEHFSATLKKLEGNRFCFAGHNIKEFDIPFLCRRMIINQLSIPSCMDFQQLKPWETPIVDTLHLWRFGDIKNYTSLNLLAAALGIPSPKDDINGSMIGDLYWNCAEGAKKEVLERIRTYCQKDVLTTANVLLRLQGRPIILEENIQVSD